MDEVEEGFDLICWCAVVGVQWLVYSGWCTVVDVCSLQIPCWIR